MKKRIISLLLVVVSIFLLASCGKDNKHEHIYTLKYTLSPTCEVDGQKEYECECGKTKSPSFLNPCTRTGCDVGLLKESTNKYKDDLVLTFNDAKKEDINLKYNAVLQTIESEGAYDNTQDAYSESSPLVQKLEGLKEQITLYSNDYSYLSEEYAVAQFLRYYDEDNDEYSSAYLKISAFGEETYSNLQGLYRKIYDSSFREFYYHGWSEQDVQKVLGNSDIYTNPEYLTTQNKGNELLVEYQKLSNKGTNVRVATLYEEFVENKNKLATLTGYNNYLEYAYENEYSRDYNYLGTRQTTLFVKQYLAPLYKDVVAKYNQLLLGKKTWTDSEIQEYNSYYNGSMFESVKANKAINDYFSKLSDLASKNQISYSKQVEQLLEDGLCFRSDYEGAFVQSLSRIDGAVMLIGDDYNDGFTFVHEFGHYCNEMYNKDYDIPLSYDLAETHSQGNEVLYLSYLKGVMSENAYDLLTIKTFKDFLSTILLSSFVSVFEDAVYTSSYTGENSGIIMADGKITANEYDALFKSIKRDFGVDEYFTDTYWRYVTVDSAGYYISYAVSLLGSMQLYSSNGEDGEFDANVQKYLKLITYTDSDTSLKYKEVLNYAGLQNPENEELFRSVKGIYESILQ